MYFFTFRFMAEKYMIYIFIFKFLYFLVLGTYKTLTIQRRLYQF